MHRHEGIDLDRYLSGRGKRRRRMRGRRGGGLVFADGREGVTM
jgi:hypothetical protein